MFITQISVYLENNKGTLRSLTKILASNNIDLLALSIADTTHFGLVRIILREADVESAIKVLNEEGFMAKTNNVIVPFVVGATPPMINPSYSFRMDMT